MIPQDNRIPVTLITGFLGSGKTTFLNHLLTSSPGIRFAIIENEFGEIGIDHELVVNVEGGIFELANGCICCQLNENLIDLLYHLMESGKPFDHLLIETTGLADPAPVAMNFLSDFGVQGHFRLDAIVALADAAQLEMQCQTTLEAPRQLAGADAVVLNKTEQLSDSEKEKVEAFIRTMNPSVEIISTSYARVEPSRVLHIQAFSGAEVLRKMETLSPKVDPEEPLHTFKSVSLELSGKVNPILFDHWINSLVLKYTGRLYRVKGILNMHSMKHKIIVQAVGTQVVSERGPEWKADELPLNRLVFIGRGLDKDQLRMEFETCISSE